MAANRFTGAITDKWALLTNWSTGAVPTAADGNVATFDASSPNCTLDTSNKVCNGFDATLYTNTLTFTTQLTVSGDITLGASMVFAGAAGLLVNATATLTSNGKTCPQPFTISGTITATIVSTWTNSGLVTLGGTTLTTTVDGGFLDFSAGFTHGGSTGIVTGTCTLRCIGTGTYTNPTSTGALRLNFTINTAGTLTISSTNSFRFNSATLTYTAGTVVTTSSTLVVSTTTGTTLDTNGITWNNVSTLNATTVTLASNLTVNGTSSIGTTGTATTVNGPGIWRAAGDFTHNATTGSLAGTAIVHLIGTSNFTTATSTGAIRLSIIINTAGTITFNNANPLRLQANTSSQPQTFQYVTGTVVLTGVTAIFTANTETLTLDVGALTFPTVTLENAVTGTGSTTLAGNLNVSGVLTLGADTFTTTVNGPGTIVAGGGVVLPYATGSVVGTAALRVTGASTFTVNGNGRIALPVSIENNTTFDGTGGLDADRLTATTAGKTLTLTAARTYRVRGASQAIDSVTMASATPGTLVSLNFDNTQKLRSVVATDIDSSRGNTVWNYAGTLSNCRNWVTRPKIARLTGAL